MDSLLSKLEYYRIWGSPLLLIKSYLSDRKQSVQLETYNSDITSALPCSCIQGSKLSSLLYTLYTNEIPLLYKLINNKLYKSITGQDTIEFKNIEHLTVKFVDDSNNVITFDD